MNLKKLTVISVLLLQTACSSTEGLEMPNSPCACSYEGKLLTEPSGAEYDDLIDQLYG